MINSIIEFSGRNKFIVFVLVAAAVVAGLWSMRTLPLNHSAGPFVDGCEPTLRISIRFVPSLVCHTSERQAFAPGLVTLHLSIELPDITPFGPAF